MRIALIAPPNQPKWKEWTNQSDNYFLCLARLVLANEDYARYFADRARTGGTVIMDNGAAEEGTLNYDQLNRAAELCRATEIVCPDSVNNTKDTMRLASQLPYLEGDVMVVPQGKILADYLQCLDHQLGAGQITSVGISKYCPIPRHELLGELEKRGYHKETGLQFHLLGLTGSPLEAGSLAVQFPWIRGMDTACPIAYAIAGVYLDDAEGHIGLKWDAPEADDDIVKYNIRIFKAML